jgi:hypothetical protein
VQCLIYQCMGWWMIKPQRDGEAANPGPLSSEAGVFVPGSAMHVGHAEQFLPSAKYLGTKAGMAFKLGTSGIGYYPDSGSCTLLLQPLVGKWWQLGSGSDFT